MVCPGRLLVLLDLALPARPVLQDGNSFLSVKKLYINIIGSVASLMSVRFIHNHPVRKGSYTSNTPIAYRINVYSIVQSSPRRIYLGVIVWFRVILTFENILGSVGMVQSYPYLGEHTG